MDTKFGNSTSVDFKEIGGFIEKRNNGFPKGLPFGGGGGKGGGGEAFSPLHFSAFILLLTPSMK